MHGLKYTILGSRGLVTGYKLMIHAFLSSEQEYVICLMWLLRF